MFLDHTQRHSTVGRTPLDECSARRRDLYLTTHDTHNRQISMPPVGFEPTISAGERPQAAADTVASCWIFFVNYTMMHGSTNIKPWNSLVLDMESCYPRCLSLINFQVITYI